jgi:L,D-transpeptidase ErfK/SrfK
MSSHLPRLFFFVLLVLGPAVNAQEFVWSSNSDLVGQTQRTLVDQKDTLYDIGMVHDIGFNEIRKANPNVDAWLPEPGSEIVIPNEFILPSIREGVVVNLREYRLYFFPEDGGKVITYPVGIGAPESPSPVVSTQVKLKIEQPNWYPPESARAEYYEEHGKEMPRVIYPGPTNPLGPFAIQLDLPEYFIHGTNKPFGIGTKVSRGCIRLDNEDLEKFVWEVPKYTPVRFIKESIKVGMRGDTLYVELHLDDEKELSEDQVIDRVIAEVGRLEKVQGLLDVDFLALNDALRAPTGLPQKIGTKKADLSKVSLETAGLFDR